MLEGPLHRWNNLQSDFICIVADVDIYHFWWSVNEPSSLKGGSSAAKGIVGTNHDVVYVEGHDVLPAMSAALQPYAQAYIQLQLIEAPSLVLSTPNYRIFKIVL